MPANKVILEEARTAGLLEGDKTAHVSIRTTPALLRAAKDRAGVQSTTEVVELALASLALPDPAWTFMRDNIGVLGADHDLDI